MTSTEQMLRRALFNDPEFELNYDGTFTITTHNLRKTIEDAKAEGRRALALELLALCEAANKLATGPALVAQIRAEAKEGGGDGE
jgi:hypothetical protein